MHNTFFKLGDHFDCAEITIAILSFILSIGLLLTFCEFGEMVTHQFDSFYEKLYQCDYYLFPIELQQMLVIFMAGTQRSTNIRGYANTEYTRNAFKRVILRILPIKKMDPLAEF